MKKNVFSRSLFILVACIFIVMVLSFRLIKIQSDVSYEKKIPTYQQAMLQNFDETSSITINPGLIQNKQTFALYFYSESLLSNDEIDNLTALLLPLLADIDEKTLRQSLESTTPILLQNPADFTIVTKVQKGQIPFCYLEENLVE